MKLNYKVDYFEGYIALSRVINILRLMRLIERKGNEGPSMKEVDKFIDMLLGGVFDE